MVDKCLICMWEHLTWITPKYIFKQCYYNILCVKITQIPQNSQNMSKKLLLPYAN